MSVKTELETKKPNSDWTFDVQTGYKKGIEDSILEMQKLVTNKQDTYEKVYKILDKNQKTPPYGTLDIIDAVLELLI